MGGVRTALYNYLFARKHGGKFLLRIEDTDQKRFVPGAEEYILEALRWCGMQPDEGVGAGGEHGPYRQSERKPMYRQYAEQLVNDGFAYYAFDTEAELEEQRESARRMKQPNWQYNGTTRNSMKNSLTLSEDEVKERIEKGEAYTIRMKVPRKEEIRFQDAIRGWVVVHSNNIDDKVLFKGDGMPTYHLANIVDDHLMGITHVIRGEEWLPSAPLHVLLYRYFGWEDSMPQFSHLPLLLKPDPTSYVNKKTWQRYAEVFAKEFLAKEEQVEVAPEKVNKFMTGFFSDPKSISQKVSARENDDAQTAAMRLFLKGSLYGKLSKRDGDRLGFPVFPLLWKDPKTGDNASGYRESGYFADSFVNMLAFLGWNPGTTQEIFNMDELIEAFTLERVGKAGAKFDLDKTRWFNQQYLRAKTDEELAKMLQEKLPGAHKNTSLDVLASVAAMMKERATFIHEMVDEGGFLFEAPETYDEQTIQKKWKDATPAIVREYRDRMAAIASYDAETLEADFKAFLEEKELGFGAVLPNIRLLITGRGMGPSMFSICALLGREEVLNRIDTGLDRLAEKTNA